MTDANGLLNDTKQIINSNGQVVRIRYYSVSGAVTNMDDDVAVTKSGNDYFTSGLVQPVSSSKGTSEAVLLQQGRLLQDDVKVYLPADVATSGLCKFAIGSPNYKEMVLTNNGVVLWSLNGVDIYKKCYLRTLPAGSFDGE